ncbi:hypothetical protein BJY14_005745 [Actinomadura luteofluorescens]|uniref:Uncharacterized protein n=1 Tax=Actinomadura luteofluorescens TaxID=46163 RepID=A0A7Y9JHW0_9ACTN|nr:hypothetical protein [Actinomadura luteofluorescens]
MQVRVLRARSPGGGVDGPADVLPESDEVLGTVARPVHHDPSGGVLVGVADVEDVAGVDLVPGDLARAVAAHHAEPGAVRVVPDVGHSGRSGQRQVDVEHHRQVQPDHVVLGDREIVHHRRARHLDLAALGQRPVRREPVVGEEGLERPVPEEQQVAGDRVLLRMRGHGAGEAPAEVAGADRLQLGRHLVGESGLHQRPDPARVRDDVGVGLHRAAVEGEVVADERRLVEVGVGPHPPVAVPLGAAVPQPDAVDHSVAGEPVPARLAGLGVRSVAQVAAGQFGGQHAGDLEVAGVGLVGDGGQVTVQPGGGALGGVLAHLGAPFRAAPRREVSGRTARAATWRAPPSTVARAG